MSQAEIQDAEGRTVIRVHRTPASEPDYDLAAHIANPDAHDIAARFEVEDWTEVSTLQNGWQVQTGFTPAFYKDPFGVVRIRGRVINGTNETAVFTLPEGYRPQVNLIFAIPRPAPTGGIFSQAWLFTNGEVTLRTANTAHQHVFDGITFRAA
jgi:hypothetical protein